MSIWCSGEVVGHGDHQPMRGGDVRTYAEGFSNHYPSPEDGFELPAGIDVAHIAPWCVPGHDEDCGRCSTTHDWPEVGDWARLTMFADDTLSWWGDNDDEKPRHVGPRSMSLVIDENAARQLAADLLAWADRPKVPRDTEPETDQPKEGERT